MVFGIYKSIPASRMLLSFLHHQEEHQATDCNKHIKPPIYKLQDYHQPTTTMSANDNNNTSTLKSYVDSATGAVQNVVGSIIGSTGDEVSTTHPGPHPGGIFDGTEPSILTRDTTGRGPCQAAQGRRRVRRISRYCQGARRDRDRAGRHQRRPRPHHWLVEPDGRVRQRVCRRSHRQRGTFRRTKARTHNAWLTQKYYRT